MTALFTPLLLLCNVLVGADTGGLEGLRAQLLILVGDEVDAERELVDVRALAAKVEDTDLGVGHTTVEAGLRVWLSFHHCQHVVLHSISSPARQSCAPPHFLRLFLHFRAA